MPTEVIALVVEGPTDAGVPSVYLSQYGIKTCAITPYMGKFPRNCRQQTIGIYNYLHLELAIWLLFDAGYDLPSVTTKVKKKGKNHD